MSLSYSTRNGVSTPDALTYKDASYIANIIGSGVPTLDQDINLISMVQAENMAELNRQQVPSGWLDTIGLVSATANTGVIRAAGATANVIQLGNSALENVVVNGYKVGQYKSFTADSQVTLNAAPSSGERTDLLFLEVWLKEIKEPASSSTADRRVAGLLDDGTIPTYGNVDYYGSSLRNGGITNDLIDSNVGLETNRRIQVQYRVRIVDDIDIATYEEGIDDTSLYAWPTNKRTSGDGISETSYNFSKMTTTLNDAGLYRAGAGDATSKTNIGSLDGYVYAIPICAVHRRNSTAYNVSTNPNGAGVAIGGTSDRPDGLFYDQIAVRDIIDLRHQVSFTGLDYYALLQKSMQLLLKGQLYTSFVIGDDTGLKNTIRGTEHMYCEQFGGSDANYVNNRSAGNNPSVTSMDTNGQLISWDDAVKAVVNHSNVAQGTTALPSNTDYGAYRSTGTGNWILNDVITITCPTWAIIDASETVIYRQDTGADITADFNISGDGSSVTCTVTPNPPAWTAVSNISVVYEVEYPAGMGLVNLPNTMLKMEDSSGNLIPFINTDTVTGVYIPERAYILTSGHQYGVWHGANDRYGAFLKSTSGNHPTAPSNNTVSWTIPSGITISGIAFIYNGTTLSYLQTLVTSWSQSGTTVTINTSSGITTGDSIELELYIDNKYCSIQEHTKGITSTLIPIEVTVTVDGSGDGETFLDYGDTGKYVSDMYGGTVNIRKTSDNGIATGTVAVSSEKVTISGCSVVSQDVKTTVVVSRPLLNNDHLRIWYDYIPYIGTDEGSKFDNVVQIKSSLHGLYTSGTGDFVSTRDADTSPLSVKLPLGDATYDWELTNEELVKDLAIFMKKDGSPTVCSYYSGAIYQEILNESLTAFNWSAGSTNRGYNPVIGYRRFILDIYTTETPSNVLGYIAAIGVGDTNYNSLKTVKLMISTFKSHSIEDGVWYIQSHASGSANDSYQILGRPLVKNY